MRAYEVVYVLTPDLEEEQVEEKHNEFKSVIERYGGAPGEIDVWGKRRLAYEIDDYQEGIYALRKFQGENQVLTELERSLKMDESILRYLIARDEDA
ncbi:30S ribosomal protein S6 [Natranaerobius thermophilus]|uniref:Small ribosomal subunit protein bS6 n=1 Tax=Natranaerobius thermophilus (strain ATCC BAA-1301 / DSM 18059 / JW/NM-WN-LF) TaxID=457570 RepID=RS6_NATTJ|nr:30S ribosomal protein S6 [Natranaerobius thermophilus]B2A456.1 RecName: Full=Small ribosomal subunit protein bS6; AltName: Full=30S ribosomal protein S6 [Natranaerobius thermophilus JW/NM-WN-LF]ACB86462.1 ribosomal protein S6 [Natranaerobius thermophilus JW/NM-WN-LF]